ncbi:MAG: 3-dehydroquinate synthase [Dehalococcoidia bacterium]|nr:3-dehydroquinate synthase [Dehalococcoidia bacterium]
MALGERSYNVYIGAGALDEVAVHLRRAKMGPRLALVTNPTVFELHGNRFRETLTAEGFDVSVFTVPDGEEYKSLESAGRLYTEFSEALIERSTPLLALGGGIIGDLAGFVAATYMRGMPLVQLPTTLLAQVDSSIGGKTAVNHGTLKNQIGAFYQPVAVFSDIAALKTLPRTQLSEGLAEIIKSAVIGDELLFRMLERRTKEILAGDERLLQAAVSRAAAVKISIVRRDEHDTGLRNTLNFGHTAAHAIETITNFKVSHGEAVAAGMLIAGRVAAGMGVFPASALERLRAVISAAELPLSLPLNASEVLEAIKHDKKMMSGKLKFILPTRIGQVVISDRVTPDMVAEAIVE